MSDISTFIFINEELSVKYNFNFQKDFHKYYPRDMDFYTSEIICNEVVVIQ